MNLKSRIIPCALITVFVLQVCCIGQAAQHDASTSSESKPSSDSTWVIGLSPFLNKATKDDIYRGVVSIMVEGAPLNSRVLIYDAFNARSITQVTVPEANAFKSAKTRANQFAPAIAEIKKFLGIEQPRPSQTSTNVNFDNALQVPQFSEFLRVSLPASSAPVHVLLVGSPLHLESKEPGFSMIDGYFPSDGHLRATREESVYGLGESTRQEPTFLVAWLYPGDPWINDLHKEKISRFWTLFLQARGSQLVALTSDFTTALQSFQATAPTKETRWSLDPQQTKVEMLRVSRRVQISDWLMGENITRESTPPSSFTGPMKIGIRWADPIDLDLYAAPRPGADTLFFQHPRSVEGYYYKDHRSSPGREYEFIEFEKPIDIREVQAFVNFYKGHCPGGPKGEVRIEFDGRIYGAPFGIEAGEGNRGQTGASQESFWARIPVQQILKLGNPSG